MAAMAKMNRYSDKYPWKDEQKLKFLRILINWKATRGQTAAYKWPEIVAHYNKVAQPPADKSILLNKLGNMKAEYKEWKNLLQSEPDLRIDPHTGIIIADGLWWNRKLTERPNLKKFRDAGIPKDLEDLYSQLFDGATITGETDTANDEIDHDTTSYFPDNDHTTDDSSPPQAPPCISASPLRVSYAPQPKRKKTPTHIHSHDAAVHVLVDKCMTLAPYTPPSDGASDDQGPSIDQALAELHRLHIEGSVDGRKDFLGFAVTHLGSVAHRRLFMGCPSDTLKAAYLEHNYKVAYVEHNFKTFLFNKKVS